MDVTQTAGAAQVATPPTTEQTDAARAASDFETFLSLLTAQMRNQDPLNPMDSTQFVSQLAAFSTVEQQINTVDRLRSIEALLGGDTASAAGWIGRDVAVESATFEQDASVRATFEDADTRDTAAVFRDPNGTEVARVAVAGGERVAVLPAGILPMATTLTVTRDVVEEDGTVTSEAGRIFDEVVEVRSGEDGPVLISAGGARIDAGVVSAIR